MKTKTIWVICLGLMLSAFSIATLKIILKLDDLSFKMECVPLRLPWIICYKNNKMPGFLKSQEK